MTSTSIDELNRTFGLQGRVKFRAHASGLVLVDVHHPHAHASFTLQGAQLLTFQPTGTAPVVWISNDARYEVGKGVRGGIPVCWPWFGPHASDAKKPAHGFVRTAPWQVTETHETAQGAIRVVLDLPWSPAFDALWPQPTTARIVFTVDRALTVDLVTRNTDTQPITVSAALHTYFHVSDIERIAVQGLENCAFIDKVDGGQRKTQQGAIRFSGELDRVYLDTAADTVIDDPGLQRRIRVAKRGSRSTVVWNPWVEKAQKLGDMGAQGYRAMVCVEAANALDDSVTVAPGKEHVLTTIISVDQ